MPMLILTLLIATFCLSARTAAADAPLNPSAGAGSDSGPGVSDSQSGESQHAAEQVKRVLLRALDDLLVEKKFALEDVRELEQQMDAITSLNRSRRKELSPDAAQWYH